MCIYCDYCVYHYKSTELISLYTLDIGLQINIIIIIITFTRFLSFLCLSVHTSPIYLIVSFSTSSFTSTYPFITSIVLSVSSSTSHVLIHLLHFRLLHLHLKSTCISVSFVPHTHRSSAYFHSNPLEPLTGRHPPLTINLTKYPW